MAVFRPAAASDLADIYYIFYLNETAYASAPRPAVGEVSADFRHIHKTGRMYVAEEDGRVRAFAASITREGKTFLSHLYVDPQQQSEHLGTSLLRFVLPEPEQIRFTVSSTDLRAQSLYIRLGMQPQWPNYLMAAYGLQPATSLPAGIECIEGHADDPEFIAWDAQASGRRRSEDIAYWVGAEQEATPLWFRRQGKPIGYGYVNLNTSSFWFSGVCTLGPLGVKQKEDAADCVLAALHWARQHGAHAYRIDVPGPHPSLAPLLDAGFRIFYVETFVSSAHAPFFDARCYIPSGSNLF